MLNLQCLDHLDNILNDYYNPKVIKHALNLFNYDLVRFYFLNRKIAYSYSHDCSMLCASHFLFVLSRKVHLTYLNYAIVMTFLLNRRKNISLLSRLFNTMQTTPLGDFKWFVM